MIHRTQAAMSYDIISQRRYRIGNFVGNGRYPALYVTQTAVSVET